MIAKHEKEDQKLNTVVPAGLIHFSAGFAFGKWNVWAQFNGYWYRGTDQHIDTAFAAMLGNAASNSSVSRVVNPDDGRRKENKQEAINLEEDF